MRSVAPRRSRALRGEGFDGVAVVVAHPRRGFSTALPSGLFGALLRSVAARCAAGILAAMPPMGRVRAGFNWIVGVCYFVRWWLFWSVLQALHRDGIRSFRFYEKNQK